ncbi:DUF1772 domain-containing protein [Bdellovibrio svalbardensis]|uniref:DUF1772 domain-containing protein n=1 Tax=Bdellovibrio svalbardensis TaxID=2972972 RepID=A0ABT6DEC3_9BACT|nr:DUF1772 domain-containing protein [Bdellovibrio svalbardensis]MDG0815186.1 DUF1772 domain-containing protein [Bdellovibrio svalbardensis]
MKFNQLMKYTSLLLVGLLAGNSFAFVLGMGSAMKKLSASSYVAFHESMQRSFLSWTPMLCVLLIFALFSLLVTMRKRWKELEFYLVLLALVCVLDELFMTWTGNYPLNKVASVGWGDIRTQWLHFMYWRCALLIVGFGLLLASVFTKRSVSPISRDVAAAF